MRIVEQSGSSRLSPGINLARSLVDLADRQIGLERLGRLTLRRLRWTQLVDGWRLDRVASRHCQDRMSRAAGRPLMRRLVRLRRLYRAWRWICTTSPSSAAATASCAPLRVGGFGFQPGARRCPGPLDNGQSPIEIVVDLRTRGPPSHGRWRDRPATAYCPGQISPAARRWQGCRETLAAPPPNDLDPAERRPPPHEPPKDSVARRRCWGRARQRSVTARSAR